MKPKEYALKLCQSFGKLGMNWEQTQYTSLDLSHAKECALITANEMLNFLEVPSDEYAYWQDIKKEITAL